MIRIEKLSKRFEHKVILDEQSFQFPIGKKIAIVGDNGAGKTSLLNILCGLDSSDEGEVLKPGQCLMGYLPQEPNQNPRSSIIEECETADVKILRLHEKMNEALKVLENQCDDKTLDAFEKAETQYRLEGGYELRSRTEKILLGLGFDKKQLMNSPRSLSGGWRMRVELAKLFLINPDVLILDEPTNHLDLPSLAWVEKYLQSFTGTLIFVSHDRHLLNRLADFTVHIAYGRLTPYAGNYDFFIRKQAENAELAEKTLKNLRDKRDSLQEFVDKYGAKATKAAQAQSKRKMIDRLETEMEDIPVARAQEAIHFHLPPPAPNDRVVLNIENGVIGYEHALCKNINLLVEKGQKIAIIGANGIGKSTLLKTIVGIRDDLGGNFSTSNRTLKAYFSQDQLEYLTPDATVLENLLMASPIGEPQARSILGGFLFKGPDVFKPISVLSGGEKSRVGLACVLVKKSNLILLDEPTNHLDMNSIACLTKALEEYTGTIIFVSHDRDFIDAICTHVFVMTKDGQAMLFEGKIDDYQRMAHGAGFPNVFEVEDESKLSGSEKKLKESSSSFADEKLKEKERNQVRKRLKKLEEEMSKLQGAIQNCDKELLEVASDHLRCYALAKQKTEFESELQILEDEWLKLQH